jgi:hypothetical protein
MRKGKGRPDITKVMFYPGYPSGSNSSFDSLGNLNVFLLIRGGGRGEGGGGGAGGGWQGLQYTQDYMNAILGYIMNE